MIKAVVLLFSRIIRSKDVFYSLGKYKTFQTAENSFPKNARSCDDRREEFS